MIPVFERAKMVHALDRAATVTGLSIICSGCLSYLLQLLREQRGFWRECGKFPTPPSVVDEQEREWNMIQKPFDESFFS
jgi:hypothetical protein